MKSAEEYLCSEFDCNLDELQLAITLNPDKDKIIRAMKLHAMEFLEYVLSESAKSRNRS